VLKLMFHMLNAPNFRMRPLQRLRCHITNILAYLVSLCTAHTLHIMGYFMIDEFVSHFSPNLCSLLLIAVEKGAIQKICHA